jgi:hypothetical protein
MKPMIVLIVLCLAVTCGFAAEDGTVCKPFIERNETCKVDLLKTCSVVLKAKMLEQIEASPTEFRDDMREGLDGKVQGFCNGFVSQVTGEQALGVCTQAMGGTDAETQGKVQEMKICLAKETCTAYAECAVRFD